MVLEVACPSPIGVMLRGTGRLLGAISTLNGNSKLTAANLPYSCVKLCLQQQQDEL